MPSLGPIELIVSVGFVGIFVAVGWAMMREWDRRNTAARDLHALAEEARALTEQNALLAEELTDVVRARLEDRGRVHPTPGSDPATS